MSQHILLLDVPTTTNPKTFRVIDNSVYISGIQANNCFIQILTPGSTTVKQFSVLPGFNLLLNASSLRLCVVKKASDLINLPEGLYIIKYSVNPNSLLFVEYSYLHNASQYQQYISLVCELYSKKSLIPFKEFSAKRNELWKISKMIKDAKALVEDCNKVKEGLNLFKECTELINSFQTNCNGCK